MSEVVAQKPRVRRSSSDATRFHMSTKAVDRSVEEYATWSEKKCVKHLAVIRWGSFEAMPCPHCNTCTEHYFYEKDLRWKCKHCGSKFSVTSQTVFSGRKLPYRKLLAAIHLWACGAAGQPALELRRMLNLKSYNSAFTLVSKLREGLMRGFNTGLISGVVEMDGAHASGRRAAAKRGKPQNYQTPDSVKSLEDQALLTTAARQKKRREEKAALLAAGGRLDPNTGAVHEETRRIVFTLRRRSGVKGQGAALTRVAIGLAETPDVAEAFVNSYVAVPESVLATDTGTAFSKVGKRFQMHMQVNHSETLSGPNGEHNNLAESLSARQDRSEKGVYLNIEPKYLHDYAVENGFREDNRRKAPGAQADLALHFALNVGESHYWRGYTHGRHRKYEVLANGHKDYPSSGPAKGAIGWNKPSARLPR